jgi:hypothetical protein
MRPLVSAACLMVAAAAVGAQPIPARDLFSSPLGLIGVPAALGDGAAAGVWNPATALVEGSDQLRLGVASLNAPVDIALTGQLLTASRAVRRVGTLTVSLARAGVADLVRTDTDPQSIGGDIPYAVWVSSVGLSRRIAPSLVIGAASRWVSGRADLVHRGQLATDVGVVVDRVGWRDLRVGASSFLLAMGTDSPATYTAAADARLVHRDSTHTSRAGLGVVHTPQGTTEVYPFVHGRFGRVDLRGGPVRVTGYGTTTWRSRLAIMLEQDRFSIGVVQESNSSGLTPTYQIAVTTTR